MRVALVHHRLAAGGGGMERYLADLVRGFQDAGDAVQVFAREIDPQVAQRLRVTALPVPTLPAPRFWRTALFSRAVQRLELMQQHELVISLARTAGQHVHVCGGTHPGYLEALGIAPGYRDRCEIAAERAAVARSRHVVAHAQGLAEELRRAYAVPEARLHVLYPPLDTDVFGPADEAQRAAARRELGLDPALKYFVFPSMGHARKGFDLVLEAMAELQEQPVRLLVAGRDPGHGLPGNVQALGYVRDMRRLYHAVDGTLLPSRYEPFGLVLAESLQCGTPVITSALAGVAELMQPGDGIVLSQLSARTVREAILQLCEAHLRPAPRFAERNGLTLVEHVEELKAVVSC
ncbi:MAG TPA: glycosyltransferase family 4 protein [Solimonas sp.]|nr:glycosyltransferase family 4 protein [Solimonas sp.]